MNWEAENIMQIYKRKVAEKDAENAKLRAMIREMIPWLASVGEEVVSGKPQEDVRNLISRAEELVNGN